MAGIWLETACSQADRAARLLHLLGEVVDELATYDAASAQQVRALLTTGTLCRQGPDGEPTAGTHCVLFDGHRGECVKAPRSSFGGNYPLAAVRPELRRA